ncbi:MAG: L-serine ammonia-lyase, iron-sulfur-dependent, subunit alpha [Sphaerochaetaceae bacterium]
MNMKMYQAYVDILRSELVPALGCTEPIAIAFAAARAREVLGEMPESIMVECSGNIIKNVQSVTVPNSNGQKGIDVAATLGVVGGDASKGLEVLTGVTSEETQLTRTLVRAGFCSCSLVKGKDNLYIRVVAEKGIHKATVEVSGQHTNVTRIEKDGKILFWKGEKNAIDGQCENKKLLTVESIFQFANTVRMEDIQDVIDKQVALNSSISQEGQKHVWGAQVGRSLLKFYDKGDVRIRARAAAAAGSDARMSGCALPVVINSGSGNQGMTVSLPVVEYAKELGASHDQLVRALVVSNLISIMEKSYIGDLSAFCGAVTAAAGAGCGITYLYGGGIDAISKTLTNTLADVGGIVCDGAKPSCAAKISSALEAAIMGFEMGAKEGITFRNGEGLVKMNADETVKSFGRVGKEGMKSTDEEILQIMLERRQGEGEGA